VVAIDTTTKDDAERKVSLDLWIKRTQEVLAYRSLQGKPFHRLYNLFRTKRLIEIALARVLGNQGANTAGIDGVTKAGLRQETARKQLVDEIWQEMSRKTYRPAPVRRVHIPKADGGTRPLGIPTLKDRVVQEMLRLILEPIYEAKFYPHSYGFRPFRSTHHAVLRIKDLIRRGYGLAIEGDIRKCFDLIHHEKLLAVMRQTIKDEAVIRLVRQMLKAGAMEDRSWHITDEGVPQGGIASPLLSNIYLNELDWFIHNRWGGLTEWERRRKNRGTCIPCFIIRYADDFVVLVDGSMQQAQILRQEIARFLMDKLYLELSPEKTCITPAEEGLNFLGFQVRKFGKKTLIFPSKKAIAKFKEKVRDITWTYFGHDDVTGVVNLNRYIVGWGMYYRHVSSAKTFTALDNYVWWRVFRTTFRLRRRSRQYVTPGKHYREHYIAYRYDLNRKNRWRGGANYGVWMDQEHKTAIIVTSLRFIPIKYLWLHPQLNPFVPEERKQLEERRVLIKHLENIERGEFTVNWEYGPEWRAVRQEILTRSDYTCISCGRHIQGRQAHVHHLTKIRQAKSRHKANLIDNLVSICPKCHFRAERKGTLE
jgi:RNA-directed DNA polymerase